jgi:large subunit ribosomal protein L1|uniref:Large ribosomal subunit protein uL1 n=1 Tax=candidate division WOR-3 bacterium TaxID=2052148 RepID=A0A7V3RHN7_UNCW3
MKRSKRYKEALSKIDRNKKYPLKEAIELLKSIANAKINESVDIAVKLNINTKKQDQQVRGTSDLPYGTGKTKKILVLTKGEKEKEAKEAGADYVGFEEYIEKIKSGWLDFDCIIATPDAMSEISKLGKILGPKGLMPSPKTGTVTFEVGPQVKALKKGKIEFKSDKGGCVHALVGKVSFPPEALEANIRTFVQDLIAAKPPTVKGQFIKSLTISSTFGPGIKLDEKEFLKAK